MSDTRVISSRKCLAVNHADTYHCWK